MTPEERLKKAYQYLVDQTDNKNVYTNRTANLRLSTLLEFCEHLLENDPEPLTEWFGEEYQ